MNRFMQKTAIQFVPTNTSNPIRQPVTNAEAWALICGTYPDAKDRDHHYAALLAKTCGCCSVAGGMLEPTQD